VYPGSFNPIHVGHKWVIDHAHPVLEISLNRRGKGFLTIEELMRRCELIAIEYPKQIIAVTNSLYFREKIRALGPGIVFCVGTDTLRRLIDDDKLENVEAMKCKFAVFQRGNDQKEQLTIPVNAKFFEVPESVRYISSSEIRAETGVSYNSVYTETQFDIDDHNWDINS